MIISHKHKFVYIAPIKCASSTMRIILAPFADINSNKSDNDVDSFYHRKWHIKPKDLKNHFAEKKWDWDKYFKFTFVRNPWDRMVSFFNYQKKVVHKKEKYGIDHFNYEEFKKNTEHGDFSLWLHERNMTFFNFLTDESDNWMMDFIGKTENLQQDFDFVCDKIGIPKQQLPRANKTKHKHYTEYYNDETRKIIAERNARDIEYFGYEFGE